LAASRWLGRHWAASRTNACYRDRQDHQDPQDCACLALRARNRLTGTTRILRVALSVHATGETPVVPVASHEADGVPCRRQDGGFPSQLLRARPLTGNAAILAAHYELRTGQWLGAAAWLAISRRSRWSRWSRPAHQKMKSLVGVPPTPSGTSPFRPITRMDEPLALAFRYMSAIIL